MQHPGGAEQFQDEQSEETGPTRHACDLQHRPRHREAEQNKKEKIPKADGLVRRETDCLAESGSRTGEQPADLQRDGQPGCDRANPECSEQRALHSAGRSPPGP